MPKTTKVKKKVSKPKAKVVKPKSKAVAKPKAVAKGVGQSPDGAGA